MHFFSSLLGGFAIEIKAPKTLAPTLKSKGHQVTYLLSTLPIIEFLMPVCNYEME